MLNPSLSLHLLPGVPGLLAAHRRAGQQHDNLCGPYWVSLLLWARKVADLSPDRIAQLAGSVLPKIDPLLCVPPSASPRLDYQVSLPMTENLAAAGTGVASLMLATETASKKQYALVPLSADWTAQLVETVLELCQTNSQWEAVPIANIQTGPLWGARLGLLETIAYLNDETVEPPPADWDVGHFVALAGWVSGTARRLVVVQDTYPTLGWDGFHLQPAEALANALNRTDGKAGGILLFVRSSDRPIVEQVAKTAGFTIAAWDNGSPELNSVLEPA